MKKNILWLIAARSGSKSIPHKNIKKLGGIPLLVFRIKAALSTKISRDVWISTDSIEYSEIAKEYGAFVPFIRPFNLSDDSSRSIDVVLHAMEHANNLGLKFDLIGLLEPTSPFITSLILDNAIECLLNDTNASAIIAVRESIPHPIFIQEESKYLTQIADNLKKITQLGRQSFTKQITPSGGFYISKWDSLLQEKSFYSEKTIGFLVDDIAGLEIDEPLDFEFAQFVIEKNLFKKL